MKTFEEQRVALPRFSNFRTLYALYRDEVLYCFLGMEHGWGKLWEFYPLQLGGKGEPFVIHGGHEYRPDHERGRATRAKGKDGALEQLHAGTMKLDDYFHDAPELLRIYIDRTESARRELQEAHDRLNFDKKQAEVMAGSLRSLLDQGRRKMLPRELTATECVALSEAIAVFTDKQKTIEGALRMVEKNQSEL